jgi:hypothetical protein
MASLSPLAQADYVYIPVRVDQVDTVLRFLADLSDPHRQVVDDSDFERKVQRIYLESEKKFRALLQLLADQPERRITSAQVARSLGLPNGPGSVAGMLGAFARRSKNRYGSYWPFERLQNPADETTELMMDSRTAAVVKGLDSWSGPAEEE